MVKINSFDVFDTLISRRCIEPQKIFELLEKRHSINNLCEIRKKSESRLHGKDYSIYDIYHQMHVDTGMSKELLLDVAESEIKLELENCIPIMENLELVKNGDLLISDMYLPRETILQMLQKCGLSKEVELIVTSRGKQSGTIWKTLQSRVNISVHIGDNHHSDIISPKYNGVHGEAVSQHLPTAYEKFLIENGLRSTAEYIRESRLSNISFSNGNTYYEQMKLQFELNLPILILASILIFQKTSENSINKILFSSRDCFYLKRYFEKIYGNLLPERKFEYFYTSRISRTRCSKSYVEYFKKQTKDKCIVVDLCGTGWSLSNLYSETNIYPQTFFINHINNKIIMDEYEKIKKFDEKIQIDFAISNKDCDNSVLEMMNYTDHGMVLDVTHIEEYDSFLPIFEDPKYPPVINDYVSGLQKLHANSLQLLDFIKVEKIVSELQIKIDLVPKMIEILMLEMSKNKSKLQDLLIYHTKQDNQSMHRMKTKQ